MSQDWVANLYTTGTTGDTTLSNMELMFATLRSSFSGATSPSNPVDGNLFYDTDTDLLKLYRNAAWVGVLAGTAAFKIWVYLNAAEDGWAIDATVTDRILAFKGGSQAYNVSGGTNAGTWTVGGLTKDAHTHVAGTLVAASHNHKWYERNVSDDQTYNSGGGLVTIPKIAKGSGSYDFIAPEFDTGAADGLNDSWSSNTAPGVTGSTGAQSDAGISSDATWRPSAAVGTLQYPNTT